MRIVTDSRRPEEPKDPQTDNVFAIYRHFAPAEDIARVRQGYLKGGLAYSEIKNELYERLEGANINMTVGNDAIDPISGSVPHRSYLCAVRKITPSTPILG